MSDPAYLNHDHQIGRISGRLEVVERNMTDLERRIEKKLDSLERMVEATHNVVTSAGGSWRALAILGTIVAVLGGLITGLLQWIGHK